MNSQKFDTYLKKWPIYARRRMRKVCLGSYRWLWTYRLHIALGLMLIVILPVIAMAGAYLVIKPSSQYVLTEGANVQDKHIATGLVLGAGIDKDGKPFKELRGRLDVAAAALQRGDVHQLILSGDNRFSHYDEPTAMKRYLVETYSIPEQVLHLDFAGRSTYESCERAIKIFGQKRLVLISAGSHLPRAIYLCRHFGIETYGIDSNVEANNAVRREAIARIKALYNVYILGEDTILGRTVIIGAGPVYSRLLASK